MSPCVNTCSRSSPPTPRLRGAIGKNALDEPVMTAMGEVPRHEFVPIELQPYAYDKIPLPIGFAKTISQPFVVAQPICSTSRPTTTFSKSRSLFWNARHQVGRSRRGNARFADCCGARGGAVDVSAGVVATAGIFRGPVQISLACRQGAAYRGSTHRAARPPPQQRTATDHRQAASNHDKRAGRVFGQPRSNGRVVLKRSDQ